MQAIVGLLREALTIMIIAHYYTLLFFQKALLYKIDIWLYWNMTELILWVNVEKSLHSYMHIFI